MVSVMQIVVLHDCRARSEEMGGNEVRVRIGWIGLWPHLGSTARIFCDAAL
jgi:hypothetical protein